MHSEGVGSTGFASLLVSLYSIDWGCGAPQSMPTNPKAHKALHVTVDLLGGL